MAEQAKKGASTGSPAPGLRLGQRGAYGQRATPDPDDLTDAEATSLRMIRVPGTRRGSAAAHQPQLRAPSSTRHPISCFVFQAPRALCLMRKRPAVMPTPTILLASSAPCMPQAPTAPSALSSPASHQLSSAGGAIGPAVPARLLPCSPPPELRPRSRRPRSQQSRPVRLLRPPSPAYMRSCTAASRVAISCIPGRGSLHTGVRPPSAAP